MGERRSVKEIQSLGFDWPRYAIVNEYLDSEHGSIDLAKTIDKMDTSRAFYRKQLNDAYKFKMHTGADYSDFTDRYDEYARTERRLSEAISYLVRILQAIGKSEDMDDQGRWLC
jgi:hypothetical protein